MPNESPNRRKRYVSGEDSDVINSPTTALTQTSSPGREDLAPFQDETDIVLGNDHGIYEDDHEDGEDLFGENMENDYRDKPELDYYDSAHLDDNQYELMSPSTRKAAEQELQKRDRKMSDNWRKKNLYESDEESSQGHIVKKKLSGKSKLAVEDFEKFESIDNLEDTRGYTIKEWISMSAPRFEVKNRFKNFLKTYVDEHGSSIYKDRIRTMCESNLQSIIVDYNELANEQHVLAFFIPEAPSDMFLILNEAAKEVVLSMFPRYDKISSNIYVRISHLPLIEDIRSLRQIHLNQLIRTTGVVVSCSNVMPQLSIVKYDCSKCGHSIGPFVQTGNTDINLGSCPECQSKGPFDINMSETLYRNYQRIKIQECPNKMSAGRLPRSKDVILLGDLVDRCKPGDEVDVTGVYKNNYDASFNVQAGFPVFATVIEANYISKMDLRAAVHSFTDEDIKNIISLSKKPNIFNLIVKSIGPSIYNQETVKRAIAYSLFCGVAKDPGGKHKIRGDINVLICGDPGTAKSQLLRCASVVAPRAILSTGQGASAVGLTASVGRHPITNEWTLEAGALVLADCGLCIIDEFDKMNDADRTSIHEAMEQQTISISKAGIVSSLQARCSVLAAANPIGGRYDTSQTFSDNVDLSEPILSRFDILCIVRDLVDNVQDERLAKFVIESHISNHPLESIPDDSQQIITSGEYIPLDLLRKYIVYAREKVKPKLNQIDENKIAKIFSELRRESLKTGSIPITVRHVESIIRIAEAHARIHLRETVIDEDVSSAIGVVIESFIDTQKYSVTRSMKKIFFNFINFKKDNYDVLILILKQMFRDKLNCLKGKFIKSDIEPDTIEIFEDEFTEKVSEIQLKESLESFYTSDVFSSNSFQRDKTRKLIIQTL